MRLGLQPHATNTVALPHYTWVLQLAAHLGAPVCTHLAETPEERQFIATGAGPQRMLLERLGLWDDCILEHLGRGQHPVEHLEPILESTGAAILPLLVAHVNDASDEAIEILARTRTTVAYCPRASEYFGAAQHFGPHRYREMLQAGINVCLGTDSIINLPDQEIQRAGMSVLDDMRLLYRRDGTDPLLLLQLATVNGARALGLHPGLWRIEPGEYSTELLAVELAEDSGGHHGLAAALAGKHPPRGCRFSGPIG
jgi:aminodeoxyfutalosine deaminase